VISLPIRLTAREEDILKDACRQRESGENGVVSLLIRLTVQEDIQNTLIGSGIFRMP